MLESIETRSLIWRDWQIMLHAMWMAKELTYPDEQDAATFTAQEAMEMVDTILRRKKYKRNNPKPSGKKQLEYELGQTLMMLLMTGYISGINPVEAFHAVFVDYTAGDHNA